MIKQIRNNFPILQEKINGKSLIYIDNAATTQKPQTVIDAMTNFYCHDNANTHRGTYTLAERATKSYEDTREKARAFINAKKTNEIIFVSGTTEAINVVAQSYGQANFHQGDEIILSVMEHHSNIVPWQLICKQTGAKLQITNIHKNGELDSDHYAKILNSRTKMVALTHVSNVLGTINPIKQIIKMAHAHNIPVLIDGAQAVAHLNVDVQDLDCDFYVFSGHKMYGPTGTGVLYGKEKLLESIPPYHGGGHMIKKVSFIETTYADLPNKFEAGTQNIAGVVGLSSAIDFLNSIGIENIAQHEQELLKYLNNKMAKINGLEIIGKATNKVGVVAFTLGKTHPHDVATILDSEGVAVRAGHHCAMPLTDFYGVPATTRVSFGVYNTQEEIDIFIASLNKVKKIFG